MDTHRGKTLWRGRGGHSHCKSRIEVWNWIFLHRLQKKPTEPTPWFHTWSLWNCKTVNFYCLSRRRKCIRQSRTFQYSLLWQSISHSVVSDSLQPHGLSGFCVGVLSLPGSYGHWTLQQEYSSGLPCPSPRDLLTQGSNLGLMHCR